MYVDKKVLHKSFTSLLLLFSLSVNWTIYQQLNWGPFHNNDETRALSFVRRQFIAILYHDKTECIYFPSIRLMREFLLIDD